MVTESIIKQQDFESIAKAELNWKKLEGKTILITGATGYVPQYIIHGIMKHNDIYGSKIMVIALCRSAVKAEMRFFDYFGRDDFVLLIQDIFEEVDYSDNIDFIIHAASPAGVINSNKDPLTTFNVNVEGSKRFLELAEKKKADFLLFSSVDIYGKSENGNRFTEDYSGALDSLDPRNVYSCAKRASETLCMCYAVRGINAKIVRPTQIMADGIPLDDGRLHIDFISQIKAGNKIVLKGDGSPIRSFIYITDAITGVLTVLTAGESGQAYNICNEDAEASVLEFAKVMASHVADKVKISYDMEKRNHDPAVKHAVSVVTASSAKLQSLGWKPFVSLDESCRRMMISYGINVR